MTSEVCVMNLCDIDKANEGGEWAGFWEVIEYGKERGESPS